MYKNPTSIIKKLRSQFLQNIYETRRTMNPLPLWEINFGKVELINSFEHIQLNSVELVTIAELIIQSSQACLDVTLPSATTLTGEDL